MGHVEHESPHLFQIGSRPGSIAGPCSTVHSNRSGWRTARSAMIWYPKELPMSAARSSPISLIQAVRESESPVTFRTRRGFSLSPKPGSSGA